MDTELWFPVSPFPKGAELKRVREAQEVCGSCPVRISCLTFALRTGQKGIWGGLTEQQRLRSTLCKRLRASALAS
jgi:WhiB family redox-sensing transcriptional regulator